MFINFKKSGLLIPRWLRQSNMVFCFVAQIFQKLPISVISWDDHPQFPGLRTTTNIALYQWGRMVPHSWISWCKEVQ